MNYNAQQHMVITARLGPMVVVAGPGTGKTTTMVGRIQYLIARGKFKPEQILAITFTRKAAAELKNRLQEPGVLVTTIHALALRIISEADPTYQVIDETLERLLPDCVVQLKRSPELLRTVQQRWQYICVDEFQDVDQVQAELINLLAAERRNLCVVGDPDQSIYGFRGARLEVLLHFQEQYPEAQQYILSDNYRSQANIVQAATAVIRHNEQRIDHVVQAQRSAGALITLVSAESAYAEARAVVQLIQQQVGASDHLALEQGQLAGVSAQYSFGDIAVIYRLNAVGDVIEQAVQDSGLPHHRIGAKGIFESPAIRHYLNELPNQLLDPTQTLVQQLPVELRSDNYSDFRMLVESWDELSATAARTALLEHALIARPEDDWQPGRNAITLLTAHAAKGLEFSLVFVVGADDGIFPYTMKVDCDVAEERRLFYVAMTRAKEQLYICSARQRSVFGQNDTRPASRFITELPAECMIQQTPTIKPRRSQQKSLF